MDQVEKMDDDLLRQTFVKEEYGSYLRNIEAQIEHSYYHLGQISLIKKNASKWAILMISHPWCLGFGFHFFIALLGYVNDCRTFGAKSYCS
ncbi:DUF1572 family protein [Peijinzhouia sedimentorum]